jgi:hypothetical protein
VHHNLAVIEKGVNNEQGAPQWLRTIDHSAPTSIGDVLT